MAVAAGGWGSAEDHLTWGPAVMQAVYEVAAEGGGRILMHRGGPGCFNTAGASCPCIPALLHVMPDGGVECR